MYIRKEVFQTLSGPVGLWTVSGITIQIVSVIKNIC